MRFGVGHFQGITFDFHNTLPQFFGNLTFNDCTFQFIGSTQMRFYEGRIELIDCTYVDAGGNMNGIYYSASSVGVDVLY